MSTAHLHFFTASTISIRRREHFCQAGCGFMNGLHSLHVGQFVSDHYGIFHTLRLRIAQRKFKGHASSQTEDLKEFSDTLQALEPLVQLDIGLNKDRTSLMPKPWIATDVPTATDSEVQLSNVSSIGNRLCSTTPTDFCQAGKVFEAIFEGIDKLEDNLVNSQEERFGNPTSYNGLWEAQSKVDRLQSELCRMQDQLDLKERWLNASFHEARELQNHLSEAELNVLSLRKFKEAAEAIQAEEVIQKEALLQKYQQMLEKHLVTIQAVNSTEEIVQNVKTMMSHLQNNIAAEKVIEFFQKEASLSWQALLIATQELKQAKIASSNLLSDWKRTVEEVKEMNTQIGILQQELKDSKHMGKMVSEALSSAEEQVSLLSQKLTITEEALDKEKESFSSAQISVKKLEQALRDKEAKADYLFAEVASLKVLLKQKEKMMHDMSVEAMKNAESLKSARKDIDRLQDSEKQAEQLITQINVLESQVRSRDLLLEEIKEETYKSTEALKLAVRIKQELNVVKEREMELAHEMERQNSLVEELQNELNENNRAVKAEQALRQSEKTVRDFTEELSILKNGIQSRDEAIQLMQDEMDKNLNILSSAAENREVMRKMQIYINDLQSQLKEIGMLKSDF